MNHLSQEELHASKVTTFKTGQSYVNEWKSKHSNRKTIIFLLRYMLNRKIMLFLVTSKMKMTELYNFVLTHPLINIAHDFPFLLSYHLP